MSTIAATITRTELSLGDLTVADATYGLIADGFDLGSPAHRYEWVTSDWANGAVDSSGGAMDNGTLIVPWDVQGTSQSDLATKVTTLIAALRQSTFYFKVTLDSTDWKWRCYRADVTAGFSRTTDLGFMLPVTASIPRHPVPVSGPI